MLERQTFCQNKYEQKQFYSSKKEQNLTLIKEKFLIFILTPDFSLHQNL
jgi:hypothetical protein